MTIQRLSTAIVAATFIAGAAMAQNPNNKNPNNTKKPTNHSHAHNKVNRTHAGGTTGNKPSTGTSTSHFGSNNQSASGQGSTTRGGGGQAGQGSGNSGRGGQSGQGSTNTGRSFTGRNLTHTTGSSSGQGSSHGGGQGSTGGGNHPVAPAIHRGVDSPAKSAFISPSAPISSKNYPTPHYGNTYVTNNVTVINNNYNYDSVHYSPHVANFYGVSDGHYWGGGNPWRYGVISRPGISASFGFGFYVYTPFYAACVASPWYYYPGVPAYLPQNRVYVVSGYGCDWGEGGIYNWATGSDIPLNRAASEICYVFDHGNVPSVNELMSGGQIGIFTEGNYEYSLNADDFLTMLSDNVSSTQTISFTVTRMHRSNSGRAIIEATHVFQNPTGGTQIVYQLYRLQNAGDHYVLSDFMTSHMPFHRGGGF